MNWKTFDKTKKLNEQLDSTYCWVAGYFYSLFNSENRKETVMKLQTDGYNPIDKKGNYKCLNNRDEPCHLEIVAIAKVEKTKPDFPREMVK